MELSSFEPRLPSKMAYDITVENLFVLSATSVFNISLGIPILPGLNIVLFFILTILGV